MTREYDNLSVCALSPEGHDRTCGYWYTVTSGATAHTAFATRVGLDRWMRERGLKLETDLPYSNGVHGCSRIVGTYRTRSYLYDEDEFHALRPMLATAVMDNGDYTLGLITEDDGVRTVHYLNCNVKTRFVFDHKRTREIMN